MNRKTSVFIFYAAAMITTGLVGCSAQQPQDPAFSASEKLPSYNQSSFEEYVVDTKEWLTDNRIFLTDDKKS